MLLKTPKQFDSMEMGFANTMKKYEHLRSLNYVVIETWECQFHELLLNDTSARSFVNNINIIDPLNPLDAFFRGRKKIFQK